MPGTGLKLALAVIGGYLLGRTKKMKLAIMFGAALAGKKISTDPAQLLGQASKLIQASPELQKLDSAVRGRLLEAGKDAALAVASSRMEALTDNLVNRVENLGKPAADAAGAATQAAGQTAGAAGDAVGQAGGAVGDAAGTAGSAVGGAVERCRRRGRQGRARADVVARRPPPRSRSTTAWTPPTRSRTSRMSTTRSTTRRSPSRTRPWPRPRRPTSPRRPPRGPRRAAGPRGPRRRRRRARAVARRAAARPAVTPARSGVKSFVVGRVVRRQREPHQQRIDASDVVGVAQQGHRRLRLAPWIGEAR